MKLKTMILSAMILATACGSHHNNPAASATDDQSEKDGADAKANLPVQIATGAGNGFQSSYEFNKALYESFNSSPDVPASLNSCELTQALIVSRLNRIYTDDQYKIDCKQIQTGAHAYYLKNNLVLSRNGLTLKIAFTIWESAFSGLSESFLCDYEDAQAFGCSTPGLDESVAKYDSRLVTQFKALHEFVDYNPALHVDNEIFRSKLLDYAATEGLPSMDLMHERVRFRVVGTKVIILDAAKYPFLGCDTQACLQTLELDYQFTSRNEIAVSAPGSSTSHLFESPYPALLGVSITNP